MANYDFTGLMDDTEKTTTDKYDFSGLMDEKVTPKDKAKPAWDISSVDELMKQGFSPTQAGLLATGQQLSSPLYKYGNMLLGGLPNKALQAMGRPAPEAQIRAGFDKEGKDITGAINMAANVAGFARGLPMRAGAALAGRIPQGAGLMARAGLGAARGAAQLGTAGALQTPAQEEFKNWQARAMRTAGGALGGAAIGTTQGVISHFTGLLSDKAQLATGEQVRSGFGKFKENLTSWFGKKIDRLQTAKPNQRVDINKELETFKTGLEDNRKFKTLLNASPKLRQAIESKARLTLKQSQDLINQVKETVSDANWAGKGVKPSTREVQVFIDSLKSARNNAFPAMKYTDAVYGQMKTFTKSVQDTMQFGKTVNGLRGLVNNTEKRKALQTILPKEVFDKVINTVKAGNITKTGLTTLHTVIRYGILYQFVRKLADKMDIGGGGDEIQQGG